MPKKDKEINTPEAPEGSDAKDIQKWSVWTQGPKDAKETQRKFKQTTPGQVRDYKHFVSSRRFTRYEQVEEVQPKNEDAPTNSVAGGGVDMAPNAKGTKVFMKKFRVDGRTKEYREANRRIKERQEKIAQRQVQSKLDMFGVHANPFAEETESKKYLDTKEGSIEDAIIKALTNLDNPNDERETLTLPKKDVEVEEGFGKLKDASKNLEKMHKAAGIEVDKKVTKKTKGGGTVQTTTYKKRQEDVDNIHAEALRENDIVEEVEWKVQLKGLPIFYVPAKSAGEVRAMLRRQIKKPDDIVSIERSTKAAKKKDFRDRVSGKESDS